MKVAVVGVGHVGSTAAYSILQHGSAECITLISRTRERAQAEALDLQHAAAMTPLNPRVEAGDISAAAGADAVVVTLSASLSGKPDRRAAASANRDIFKEWMPRLAEAAPQAVFIIVTNPVDEMTYLALKYSDLPPERVVGAGTLIDSARLRSMVSDRYGVHPDDLRIYILGEHGDRQFPAFSIATAGGKKLGDPNDLQALFRQAVDSAYEVYRRKGYTNYAIAEAIRMVVENVLRDARRTMPVSTLIEGYEGVSDVCLSIPVVLGRQGICMRLEPVLNPDERDAFRAAAHGVRASLDGLLAGA